MIPEADMKAAGFKPEKDEEYRKGSPVYTGFPKPYTRYRMWVEGFNLSIEQPYYYLLTELRHFRGYVFFDKITDVFAAGENSAFFGLNQQRLGMQQDKVSQFLATIGKMIKELFQLVRELRVLDERMGYYADSYDALSRSRESAEITLKGIWIDMVEQGAKNPASVYGMAREVGFTTLPDLFFSTHPLKQEDVDEVIERERGEFNRKVKEVLKRKMRAFLAWKEHTFEELKNRRIFTLKYLRQHYEIINMYLNWVKPYLKQIERLHLDQDKIEEPDIVAAFETSMIEVEYLAKKPAGKVGTKAGEKKFHQIILMHFLFRSTPQLQYQQEGYNRGPIHVGQIRINFRSYVWDESEISKYKELKRREDLNLLKVIDSSVTAALDALGDELMRYLKEAGDDIGKDRIDNNKVVKAPSMNPFTVLTDLFKQPKKAKKPKNASKMTKNDEYKVRAHRTARHDKVRKDMWGLYHHYKKRMGLLNW